MWSLIHIFLDSKSEGMQNFGMMLILMSGFGVGIIIFDGMWIALISVIGSEPENVLTNVTFSILSFICMILDLMWLHNDHRKGCEGDKSKGTKWKLVNPWYDEDYPSENKDKGHDNE